MRGYEEVEEGVKKSGGMRRRKEGVRRHEYMKGYEEDVGSK